MNPGRRPGVGRRTSKLATAIGTRKSPDGACHVSYSWVHCERRLTQRETTAFMPDIGQLASALRLLLTETDGPIPHQVAITLLARRIGAAIAPETYFAAVDQLSNAGIVGRARGQGGSVFLLPQPVPDSAANPQATSLWPEPQLMPCLEVYLERQYWRMLDRPPGGLWQVVNTAMMRPDTGKWSHPDFAVVSVMPLQVLPTPILDVYSFELKAEAAGNLIAVHEALAQARQTHYGTLVWHLPTGSRYEARLSEVTEGCEQHGIGLILIRDPLDTDSWAMRLQPLRKPTTPAEIDGFLSSRLTADQKQNLRTALIGDRR